MGSNACIFYGPLTHPAILSRVIHGPANPTFNEHNTYVVTKPAILSGYRRHRVLRADYPAITKDSTPGASVRGTLATGLTDNDVRRLDIFEGSEYERVPVKVVPISTSGQQEEIVAETYVWIAPQSRLEDAEWDFETFVKEKMRFWLGGPTAEEEFGELDAMADGTGGRRLDGDIARQLEESQQDKAAVASAV